MTKICSGCGNSFETNRSDKRYCSDVCRQRGKRRGPAGVGAREPSRLLEVVERDLESAGVLETVLGQIAVELARTMTSPYTTPSALAGVSKEFTAVMDKALGKSTTKTDFLDELKLRRDRKRGLAGG
jgi:hypothetical protein